MASAPPIPSAQKVPFRVKLRLFWQRVTEVMELTQLWTQFRADARSSYRLYSRDVAAKTPEGLPQRGRHLHVVKEFFWTVMEKLSPARRVLLLIALVMLIFPASGFTYHDAEHELHVVEFDFHFWGGLLLFLLLMLQIAREIQTWLLPGAPPQIPGVAIAYTTRPANTVAGDYYDVFPRPGKTPEENRVIFAVADVAGM